MPIVTGFDVTLVTGVKVEFDESVWTKEKMAQFYAHYYKFNTIDEHAQHIAKLILRGAYSNPNPKARDTDSWESCPFFEGYGYVVFDDEPVHTFGPGYEWSGIRVRFNEFDVETEVAEQYQV